MGLNGTIKSLNHSSSKVTQRKQQLINFSRYINIEEFGGSIDSAKDKIKSICDSSYIHEGTDYSHLVVTKIKVQYKKGKGYLAKVTSRYR